MFGPFRRRQGVRAILLSALASLMIVSSVSAQATINNPAPDASAPDGIYTPFTNRLIYQSIASDYQELVRISDETLSVPAVTYTSNAAPPTHGGDPEDLRGAGARQHQRGLPPPARLRPRGSPGHRVPDGDGPLRNRDLPGRARDRRHRQDPQRGELHPQPAPPGDSEGRAEHHAPLDGALHRPRRAADERRPGGRGMGGLHGAPRSRRRLPPRALAAGPHPRSELQPPGHHRHSLPPGPQPRPARRR